MAEELRHREDAAISKERLVEDFVLAESVGALIAASTGTNTTPTKSQPCGAMKANGEEDFNVMDLVAARQSSVAMETERRKLESFQLDTGQGDCDVEEGRSEQSNPTTKGCGANDTEEDASNPHKPVSGFSEGARVGVGTPAASQPGAIPQDGPGFAPPTEDDSSNEISLDDNISSNGLVVADLVQETRPHNLPQAEEYNSTNVQKVSKQLKTRILVAITIVSAIVIALVASLVPGGKQLDDLPIPTGNTNMTPTMAPTTWVLEEHILSLLPIDTQLALEDPGSPQYRALQWLMEDAETLPSYSDDQIKQKFALVTLYYTTAGNTWNENTYWLNHSYHECQWFNQPDFARKKSFSQSYPGYLDGFLEPQPLWPCNQDGLYQHLWLDQNELKGSIPNELYWLSSLKTLSIGLNHLEGTISSHIGRLTALEGLAIFNSQIGSTIPSEIGLLSNLKVLALFKNDVKGTIPTELWKLSKLTDIVMGDNHKLTSTLPTELGAFSQLRFILFNNCNLHGTIPTELGQMSSLEWLVLYQNQLTGSLPSELGQLSNLLLHSVRGNQLDGEIPSQLGLLSNLFMLYLHENQFTGPIPTELGNLQRLDLPLKLGSNLLSGTLPTQLGRLVGIQGLEFAKNQLFGSIPHQLGRLTSMGQLTLANNSFSGILPGELALLEQSLYVLSLEGNPLLSGTLPAGLCNIRGSCTQMVAFSHFCQEESFGLSFDCSDTLCGCGCPCGK